MKKLLLLTTLGLMVFAGCDKQRRNKDCIWTINGKEYRSKNYTATKGKAIAILNCDDPDYRFDLKFYDLGFFPTDLMSYYPLSHYPYQGTRLHFYVHQTTYKIASDTGRLHAKEIDGKFQYILHPTPFVRDQNGVLDTVIFSAIINEPHVVTKS